MEQIKFTKEKDNIVKIDDQSSDDEPNFVTLKKPLQIKKKKLNLKKGTAKNLIKKTPFNKANNYEQPLHFESSNESLHKPTMQPPPKQPFQDQTFSMFSNPQKQLPDDDIQDEYDEDDDIQSEQQHFNGEQSELAEQQNDYEDHLKPSDGFASIEEEKQDLLYKFHRIESKGFKLSKKFNMYSDIKEMRAEFQKIKKDSETNSSVKFSRKMLMAVVSASEFLNKRYDPFGANLDGWSETVMENVNDGDYDNIFEKLHDKYSGKVNTPPEMELMLSLAGSAVMFHMTSTMFKGIPSVGDMAKNNPEMMNNIMKAMNDTMKSQAERAPSPEVNEGERREMRPPSINLGGMSSFGNFMAPPMMSTNGPPAMNNEPVIPSFKINEVMSDSDVESSLSNISVKKVAISEGGTRRGRKPKVQSNSENTINL